MAITFCSPAHQLTPCLFFFFFFFLSFLLLFFLFIFSRQIALFKLISKASNDTEHRQDAAIKRKAVAGEGLILILKKRSKKEKKRRRRRRLANGPTSHCICCFANCIPLFFISIFFLLI